MRSDEPSNTSAESPAPQSKEAVDRRGFIRGVALGAAGATLLAQNAAAQTAATNANHFGNDLAPQIVADRAPIEAA